MRTVLCRAAQAAELDLETLDGPTAVKLMDEGKLTSVELTQAYIDRIAALNKRGPGLNAVTQFNDDALKDAALLDSERKDGHVRGPAHGLPILLKDLIDVKGMYTSAGNFSLRNSFPADRLRRGQEAARERRRHPRQARPLRVRQLLRQPAVRASRNLTGQVLNGLDADQNPSGSSSGSGSASAAALSTLIVGTETSGSIIAPVAGATASSACARPSGSCPATASRRSPPRRTRPARWTAPSPTRR